MQDLIYLNIVYFLFAFFLIYPPNEIVSLGFSIPNLFSKWLGSEQMFFVYYHMLRILITIGIHCLLPIGYFLFMGFFSEDLNLFDFKNQNVFWTFYLSFSILFAITFLTLIYFWKTKDFSNHPVALNLKKFSSNSNWKEIANQINIEFRRVDKFSTGSLFNRIYVTDNWLIKVSLYSISVCSHQNIELELTHANELNLTQEGNGSIQYLNILIKPVENSISFKPFYVRINSFEYKDFSDKLNRPIKESCNIIIKQSLPDQFLDAFKEQITNNGNVESKREEVETCIGCMRNIANVKLVKICDSNDCRQCNCRPMWCLECLGKWFAYRQDQSQPNSWLGGKASCATCRATFCMLDVASINFID